MEMDSPFQGYREERLVSLEEAVQPLLSIVSDIEQMVETVKQNCNQPAHNLSEDESASIMLYTLPREPLQSSFSFILNKTLRSQNRQRLLPWFPYLRLFNFALSKLPSSSCRVGFRPMEIIEFSDYRKRKTFVWWDFISCTSSIERLQHRTDHNETKAIFIIECDSAKDISDHSFRPSEHEIIISQGKQFEVISSWNSTDQLKFIQIREAPLRRPLISILQPSSNYFEPIHRLQFIDGCEEKSKIALIKMNLTDNEMNTIVQKAIINKKCKILLLSENSITSAGATIIANALKNNTHLEFLSLSYNLLHDKGIQTLTAILSDNKCRLKKLSLHSTGLTYEGAKYLAEMLKKNTTLTWLHLGANELTNEGVNLLSSALIDQNETLEVLSLSKDKSIGDASVDSLVQVIMHNQTLNTLWMNDCNLHLEGAEKLRQAVNSYKDFFVLTTEQTKILRHIP